MLILLNRFTNKARGFRVQSVASTRVWSGVRWCKYEGDKSSAWCKMTALYIISLSSDTRHAAISLHHYLITPQAVCASGMDRFWNALTYRIESHLQYPSATYLKLNLKGQGDTELCVVTFGVIVQWASNHSVSFSVPSPYCCHITLHCVIMTNLIPKYLFSLRATHFKLRESCRLNVCTASPVGLKLLIVCCCVTVKSVDVSDDGWRKRHRRRSSDIINTEKADWPGGTYLVTRFSSAAQWQASREKGALLHNDIHKAN